VLVNLVSREGVIMNRLILRSVIAASLLLGLLSVPGTALADPVTWELIDLSFGDGSSVADAGHFTFDFTTGLYSSIDFTTPGGSGSHYSSLSGLFPGSATSTGAIFGAASMPFNVPPGVFLLLFQTDLINTGGTVTIPLASGGDEVFCGNAACSSTTGDRLVTGGEVRSTVGGVVTPEPSALSLLGLGLVALLVGAAIPRKVSRV